MFTTRNTLLASTGLIVAATIGTTAYALMDNDEAPADEVATVEISEDASRFAFDDGRPTHPDAVLGTWTYEGVNLTVTFEPSE